MVSGDGRCGYIEEESKTKLIMRHTGLRLKKGEEVLQGQRNNFLYIGGHYIFRLRSTIINGDYKGKRRITPGVLKRSLIPKDTSARVYFKSSSHCQGGTGGRNRLLRSD